MKSLNDDRRGRGDSGNTPPYAVEREIEDLAALVDAVRLFMADSGLPEEVVEGIAADPAWRCLRTSSGR
jgi:hypothetical protein